jgi:hypothetical protein
MPRIKVAIIGNMNNNAVNLARYLQDAELDCTVLFYPHELDHFKPLSDGYTANTLPNRTLDWGRYQDVYTVSGKRIARDLESFDFLIGSRLAPIFVQKAGRRLDVFMPTGGDIWTVPVFSGFTPSNLAKFLFFSGKQQLGIQASRAIFFDRTNNETETVIAPVIAGLPRYEHPIPCIYYPEFEGERMLERRNQSALFGALKTIRDKNDLLLIHHVKHLWRTNSVRQFDVLQEKGNDRILHALVAYKQLKSVKRVHIIMFEYGPDYQASQRLAVELGVEDCITWLPLSPRREIMNVISLCDGVIGELARSWNSYGTVMEAMTMKKPVIHNRDNTYFSGKELYSMYFANSAETLVAAWTRMLEQPDEAVQIGIDGGRWFRDVAVRQAVADIVSLTITPARQ